MLDFIDKSLCSGCSACLAICTHDSIVLEADKDGFFYPRIISESCVACGKCKAVCPVIKNTQEKRPIATLAVKNKNDEIRAKSSSGGVFTALAKKIISQNGIVFGAKFNEKMDVVHDFTDRIEGLSAFRGSKYVQSEIGSSFVRVKTFLEAGKKVLFSGTPCQIAGLKSYLGKNYDDLITVDLVCFGVPSPRDWQHFLKSVQGRFEKLGSDISIKNAFFKDKRKGWLNPVFSIEAYSKLLDRNVEILAELHKDNQYLQSFFNGTNLRPSCYNCSFKSFSSGSDLTIADFWGIQNVTPDFYDEGGVSLVFINSNKGNHLFKNIYELNSRVAHFKDAVKYNPMVNRSVEKPYVEKTVSNKSISIGGSFIVRKFIKVKKRFTLQRISSNRIINKIGILTLLPRDNYGGVLQAYALMKILKGMGFETLLIDRSLKKPYFKELSYKNRFRALFKNFIKKYIFFKGESLAYINLVNIEREYYKRVAEPDVVGVHINEFIKDYIHPKTEKIYQTKDIIENIRNIDAIIVGSDQIWRKSLVEDVFDYFCQFLRSKNIKRLSYAASFGIDEWEFSNYETRKCRKLIKKFSAVSVRETAGMQMCKEYLDVNASVVLDPVLLLDISEYLKIFCFSNDLEKNDGIFAYLLGIDDAKKSMLSYIENTLSCDSNIIELYGDIDRPIKERILPRMSEWLSRFYFARFVFTNSFHGVVFSVIFNKPFIVYCENATSRIRSLLSILGLENRIINSGSEIDEEKVIEKIGWGKVNEILKDERERSLKFLRDNI